MILRHYKYLTYYGCTILESIISGVFSSIDVYWVLIRVGIFCVIFTAVERKNNLVLKWLPICFVFLSIFGIAQKINKIESEKYLIKNSEINLELVKPEKPNLPNCDNFKSWSYLECIKNSRTIQEKYSQSLMEFNLAQKEKSTQLQNIKVNLSFTDLLPVLSYVGLSSIVILLTSLSVYSEKKTIAETRRPKLSTLAKIEIVKKILAEKNKQGISDEQSSRLHNVPYSTYKRWLKLYELSQKNNELKSEPRRRTA